MTSDRPLRSYDYVNQPYARVCEALRKDANAIFRRATTNAVERANAVGVQLRVQVGLLDVATGIEVEVGAAQESSSQASGPVSDFPLSWRSKARPGLFPHMKARLRVYPLSMTETQLEFEGSYNPPLGVVGDAIDALVGHRIAEASVLNFLNDVAARLRAELAGK